MYPDKKLIGQRIKARREIYSYEIGERITQKNLAEKIGISQSYLGDIESGRTKPTPTILTNIATFLKTNVDYLLGKTDITYDTETYNKKRQYQSTENIELNKKDEKDIAKNLEKTLNLIEEQQEGLMFDGEPLDDETKELLKISLENSMRLAKKIAKNKFTAKKYKK